MRSDPVHVRVDILVGGEQVASTDDTNPADRISIVNAPILSMDASASIVTAVNTLELVIPDALLPADSFGALSPLNDTEFLISSGYLIDGRPETQPAATMRLEEIRLEDHGDGRRVYCDLFDRAKQLERSVFWRPWAIGAGANIPELINELVQQVYPDLVLRSPDIDAGAAAMEIADTENRLAIIQKLAGSIGHTFMFDSTGVPVLVPPPQDGFDPVEQYSTVDNRRGDLLSVCRTLKREGVHNGVIVKAQSTRDSNSAGETPDPLYAEAWADSLLSPIAYTQAEADVDAPGAFPLILTSQVIRTQNELNRATRSAADLLVKQPETVTARVRPNPGLELFDVVALDHPGIGVHGLFSVGSLDRPLSPSDAWLGIGANERRT